MTDTTARLRHGKMVFETMVDLDAALKLEKAFGTTDLYEIVERIVKKGEILVTQEFRDEALENRRKQIVDFLVRNAVDARTNRPFTPNIIESAIKQAGVKIENKAVDMQIKNVIESLNKIIPIKIETKKLKIRIPAQHTGKSYGLFQEYKEKEEWLNDGSLEVVISIPVGIQSEFYDRLNSITHGSAITSEVKE